MGDQALNRKLEGWTCTDQMDLTDLVEAEHIPGSMPAGERERDAARTAFYQDLINLGTARQGER